MEGFFLGGRENKKGGGGGAGGILWDKDFMIS